MSALRLLISTRKGLFTLQSDSRRTHCILSAPAFPGHIIQHKVADPRSSTVLCSAKTGHLGPTHLSLNRWRHQLEGSAAATRL